MADADVVLAVQPPALEVIDAMKEGAILISFIYAGHQPALVKRLIEKKITCFAMEMLPRITRAQSMDALSSQSALAGYYAVQLGATHLRPRPAEDHDGCRRHRSSQGAGHGAGRRRTGGARHRASSRRRHRRLRRPAGNRGTGAVARRDIRRDRRRCHAARAATPAN